MLEWWSSVGAFEQVYWWIALPATVILGILLIINFIGGDADVDVDMDMDADMGFQFITFKNLIGFFAVFGWTGLTCIDAGLGNGSTILISFFAGIAMMALLGTIFYFMSKVTEDGTLQVKNAIGGLGEVYLTIPPRRTGFGKVQIRVQGGLRELDAVTDEKEEIKTGQLITVTDIVSGEILLVTSNK
jgi:hypothetical protein